MYRRILWVDPAFLQWAVVTAHLTRMMLAKQLKDQLVEEFLMIAATYGNLEVDDCGQQIDFILRHAVFEGNR